jgi:hypothetical protein
VEVCPSFTLAVVTLIAPLLEVRGLFALSELPDAPRFDDLQESAGADVWLSRIADVVVVVVFLRSEVLGGGLGSPAEVSAPETPAGPPGLGSS